MHVAVELLSTPDRWSAAAAIAHNFVLGARPRPPRPRSPDRGSMVGTPQRVGHTGAVLKLVLPKGSSRRRPSGCSRRPISVISRSSTVDYRADDRRPPHIDESHPADPERSRGSVAEGGVRPRHHRQRLDRGDGEVPRSVSYHSRRRPARPLRIVVAVPADYRPGGQDLPRACGFHEYPKNRSRVRYFEKRGIGADIRQLRRHRGEGARHRRLHRRHHRDRSALRAAGLKIIDTILTSLHRADRQPAERGTTRTSSTR